MQTAARVHEIAPFHVMEVQTAARALEAAGRNVIHMEIGEPDFPTPAPVIAAAQAGIADGAIYYTSALGLPKLREAIAAHYGAHYGIRIPSERVVVTAGSSAALLLTLGLLVNRDAQILLADPGYPCTRHLVRTMEGEPVGIPVGPASDYQLTAQLIADAWGPQTRGALIASPSNPTGTTVSREELGRIAEVVSAGLPWNSSCLNTWSPVRVSTATGATVTSIADTVMGAGASWKDTCTRSPVPPIRIGRVAGWKPTIRASTE